MFGASGPTVLDAAFTRLSAEYRGASGDDCDCATSTAQRMRELTGKPVSHRCRKNLSAQVDEKVRLERSSRYSAARNRELTGSNIRDDEVDLI